MRFDKHPNNPILSPLKDNDWESLAVCNPGVIHHDGLFHMLYRAAGHDLEHRIVLGYATSEDGANFVRQSDTPAVSPDEGSFDAGCVEDPRIVTIDGLHVITYAYRPFPPGRYWLKESYDHGWALPESAPNGLLWNTTNTGLMITRDFKRFKKLGRITQHDIDNRDVILFPEKINGKFVMLHRPVEWTGPDYGTDVPTMWLAFSDDLMRWRDDHLLAVPEQPWEMKKMGGSTPPLKTEHGWLVLYHAVSPEDEQYRVGAMLLDLHNPRIILARTKDFLMEPEFPYETDGYYTGCVFPTGNVILDDTLYVYYGGADRYVCQATCKVSELIETLLRDGKRT